MDKKTAQKLLHQHLHKTQAVPWINENASQRAFPFGAVFLQFVLSEGADRQSISNLCYNLTALLGGVAAHLRQVNLHFQSKSTIEAIIQRSVDLLALEYKDINIAETLATALIEQLSDWGNDGASGALAGLFGEALTLVAQTLNCVNNHDAWKEPPPLLEACARAVEAPESDWQVAVMRTLNDDTWGNDLPRFAQNMLNPEQQVHFREQFEKLVRTCLLLKCCQCYEPGSLRYSCGEYAGRYCNEHWETAGFGPASDRVDYLDAGEYCIEEEAY